MMFESKYRRMALSRWQEKQADELEEALSELHETKENVTNKLRRWRNTLLPLIRKHADR